VFGLLEKSNLNKVPPGLFFFCTGGGWKLAGSLLKAGWLDAGWMLAG
jgi:hypothetical protein